MPVEAHEIYTQPGVLEEGIVRVVHATLRDYIKYLDVLWLDILHLEEAVEKVKNAIKRCQYYEEHEGIHGW